MCRPGRGQRSGFAEGVERAGADVAIDDADAAERERPETSRTMVTATRAVAPNQNLPHAARERARQVWLRRPAAFPQGFEAAPRFEPAQRAPDVGAAAEGEVGRAVASGSPPAGMAAPTGG